MLRICGEHAITCLKFKSDKLQTRFGFKLVDDFLFNVNDRWNYDPEICSGSKFRKIENGDSEDLQGKKTRMDYR
jgi:hypothetical protein